MLNDTFRFLLKLLRVRSALSSQILNADSPSKNGVYIKSRAHTLLSTLVMYSEWCYLETFGKLRLTLDDLAASLVLDDDDNDDHENASAVAHKGPSTVHDVQAEYHKTLAKLRRLYFLGSAASDKTEETPQLELDRILQILVTYFERPLTDDLSEDEEIRVIKSLEYHVYVFKKMLGEYRERAIPSPDEDRLLASLLSI